MFGSRFHETSEKPLNKHVVILRFVLKKIVAGYKPTLLIKSHFLLCTMALVQTHIATVATYTVFFWEF